MKRAAAWFLGFACLLSGCAPLWQQMSAEPEDYQAYRRTRIAPTLEGRLAASWRYLRERPDGRFRSDVSGWFRGTEAQYYSRATNSIPRLETYLATLPNGPHAELAAERLVELRLAEQHERRHKERSLSEARAVQGRLSAADRMRREFVAQIKAWIVRLASIKSWGGRTHELDHELIYEFRLREPAARCSTDLCTKMLSLPYAIPEQRTIGERRAVFDVQIALERGGVSAARLTGPELFSRIGEALSLAPVGPSALQARTEAIARTVQLVNGAIEPTLPAARCTAEAIGTIVLARECDGVRFEVVAAGGPEDEDRIEVRPVRPAEAPR
jgi:hypothetical protein